MTHKQIYRNKYFCLSSGAGSYAIQSNNTTDIGIDFLTKQGSNKWNDAFF
jgi:hypothetical protein